MGGDSASPPPPSPDADPEEAEALRLKSLAEERFRLSSLKSALKYARRAHRLRPALDGVAPMLTALKILRASPDDHYAVLRLDPFSPFSAVKRQYKSLALTLHPDKSSSASVPGAEEAFKRVADSFRFLSDKSLKRNFDLELRLHLAAQRDAAPPPPPVETFWTACAACRLLHEFDRLYVGRRLVCPRCRRAFLAVEVSPTSSSAAATARHKTKGLIENAQNGGGGGGGSAKQWAKAARSRSRSRPRVPSGWAPGDRKRKITHLSSPESIKLNRRKEKTLAELQMDLTKSSKDKKAKSNEKGRVKEKEKAIVAVVDEHQDLSLMAVEDSDFYDFDKDRGERSFKKGQVWAIYDDDDGMPRHYGLIDDVLSYNPFRVKMSWLDIQNTGDEALVLWEKSGYHISCGRFKVGQKVDIDSVSFFSHPVNCERAAKEVYRIYPKKGSVWALYGDQSSGGEESRRYDIVVFLTSYSELNGLSMAYLEKVEGFKTIFKRREIGSHAIKWLEKDDVRLFSHQIPSRKLSDIEGVDLPGDCWELDPASLPSDLLRISWDRYASIRAIKSPTKADDEQWLIYWILYSFLTLEEMVVEPILYWPLRGDKDEIYDFGFILLEIISGKPIASQSKVKHSQR